MSDIALPAETLSPPTTARTLRTVAALADAGLVAADAKPALDAVARRYAVAVTPAIAALIDKTDALDPIALQFIPDRRELETTPIESADPIGDGAHEAVPGLIHRYPDRVLLKPVHACPVYCRFCFRREMVGPGGDALDAKGLDRALDYVARHPAIWEVIVTGGDPFILPARRIRDITDRLAAIPHLQVIRWHTRVPVVAPERVTLDFAQSLRAAGKATYVAIHANHPREFTPAVKVAINRLADAGLVLLSQSVLLQNVNADIETLETLMRTFVAHRIRPYYLHHPDLAPGTGHFRLTLAEGQELMRQLRGRVSGLCQPTYVLDIPGGHGKVPVGPVSIDDAGASTVRVEDRHGVSHDYPQG